LLIDDDKNDVTKIEDLPFSLLLLLGCLAKKNRVPINNTFVNLHHASIGKESLQRGPNALVELCSRHARHPGGLCPGLSESLFVILLLFYH
jgi:hypothetical protein